MQIFNGKVYICFNRKKNSSDSITILRGTSTKPVMSLHKVFSRLWLRVYSRAPSTRSHRGTKVVFFLDFQPMKVSEEPVGIYLFRQNPVLTTLQLRSAVHGFRLRDRSLESLMEDKTSFKTSLLRFLGDPSSYLFRRNPV